MRREPAARCRKPVSRHQAGVTFIETLVAMMVLAISLMGAMSLWGFGFQISMDNQDRSIAYNLGRMAVERAKLAGYANAAEGTTTLYYKGDQTVVNKAADSRYTVQTAIASDLLSGGVLTTYSLRTATVIVSLTSGGKTLYTTSTCMAREGV